MEFVQPIRDFKKIDEMKRELLKNGTRDYMLFLVGINTGLRISDILSLKVLDIKDQTHITIKEQKTGKTKTTKIGANLKTELDNYISDKNIDEYLFTSRKGENKPISRVQAYRILNDSAKRIGLGEIGTHTLRKTFGYHHYKNQNNIALLMNLFNHSAPSVTLRYIGLNQDVLDESMDNFSL
jgi:integrase